jgi:hypothetical protein
MISLLITEHFQFTVRLFPDGPIKCSDYIIDVIPSVRRRKYFADIKFKLLFHDKNNHDVAVKHCAMSIGLFKVDAVTYGGLVLSVEHRRTDTHSD